jgi:hypothetical protein
MMWVSYILENYHILQRNCRYFWDLRITREKLEARYENNLESGKNIKNHIEM